MPSHTGRLLLCARDPFLSPDQGRLTSRLRAAGFLGRPLGGRAGAFAVGERFLAFLTFAGCSVHIELDPEAETPSCYIRYVGPFARPTLLCGRNTRPPRCRSCRAPLSDWQRRLAEADAATSERCPIPCPTCGDARPPWDYDWREQAGYGRLFLAVEEVFPGEAVPTPALLDLLQGGGSDWRHFYVQDDGCLPALQGPAGESGAASSRG